MALTKTPIELSSTPSIVDGGNATAITIDSSENVLVGKTALEYENTAGHIFRNDGLQSSIRSGGNVADFNRLSSDGEVLRLSKDGTTVGSIGAGSSSLFIGSTSQSSGISFYGTALYPNSGGSISATNGANDLGAPTARWKDLYLSGGAYLGGTAAANALDDYEESTFTATLKGGTAEPSTLLTTTGYVTKIGRIVHYVISFENINTSGYSGTMAVNGLPYASTGGRHIGNVVPYQGGNWSGVDVFGLIENTTTQLRIMSIATASAWTNATHNASGGVYLWFSGTYTTSA